jgi:hypothetical protein
METATRVWMPDADTAHQPVNVFKIAEDRFKEVQKKVMDEAAKPTKCYDDGWFTQVVPCFFFALVLWRFYSGRPLCKARQQNESCCEKIPVVLSRSAAENESLCCQQFC